MTKLIRTKVASLFLLLAVASCDTQENNAPPFSVDITTAHHLMNKDNSVIVLDVRTPMEYASGHIKGALNINLYDRDFSRQVTLLDRDKTYIVHCSVNPRKGRGDKTINIMRELGFDHLFSLDGGFKAWRKNGMPVAR